jgi:hypothetical protein
MATAAASGSLAVRADATQTTSLGPGLMQGMSEAEVFERLNAWGIARDGELVDLRSSLTNTQSVVGATFAEARATLMTIVGDFRLEAETLRQHGLYEASQGLARLEHVIAEARQRFDAQDARHAQDLGELARRISAAPAPSGVLPQALTFRAATSPGGTVTFYPGGPAGGVVLPPAAPTAGFTTPPRQSAPAAPTPGNGAPHDAWGAWAAGRGASPQGQPSQQHDAGGAWATDRGVSPQGQPPIPDAWAAAAFAPAAAPQQPGEPPRHSYTNSPGMDGGRPREMRLDARGWGNSQPKLDIGVAVDTFQIWKDRTMMFLSRERPDVRRLLNWAETQSKETLQDGIVAQAAYLGISDLAGVEYALHDGIKMTINDSLLGRAHTCVERGCELWRALCAEWSGAAPQLQLAKARRYQDPPTCKNVQELWSKLPAWERLGEEVALSGLEVPPWLAMTALEQLLPAPLRDALVARASCGEELKTFPARLAWVKVQMEHSRGIAQASTYGGRGKDASGDVNMYSVDDPPGLGNDAVEGMSWALAEAAQCGEWGLVESLQHSIYAMKGSKGGFRKGLGKGKPGASPAAAAKGGGTEFQGVCNHCKIWGHRKSECRKLTQEMGKAGKGKAGGKGNPTGGKGPAAAPLAEVGAADGWAGDLLDSAIAGAAAEFDEWNFDTPLCSVTAAPAQTPGAFYGTAAWRATLPCAAAAASDSSRLARLEERAQAHRAQTKTQNRFAALNLLTDDAEELLAAVSGGVRGGRVIEAVVDSGAVHSVTPPGLFPGPTVPSPWSKAGRGYRAANGTGIKNLGQVAVKFCTAEGDKCNIPFQVAEVDQPLLSVAHLTGAGNRVELGHASGRVINLKTGRTIALERRGGVYIMRMYIADGVAPAPFHRQGA